MDNVLSSIKKDNEKSSGRLNGSLVFAWFGVMYVSEKPLGTVKK